MKPRFNQDPGHKNMRNRRVLVGAGIAVGGILLAFGLETDQVEPTLIPKPLPLECDPMIDKYCPEALEPEFTPTSTTLQPTSAEAGFTG